MAENLNLPGGFIPQTLPSPAPSNISTGSATSDLPHPRARSLRPGSAKEDAARRYVEGRLLHISRRFTKKFQPPEDWTDVTGYESMSNVAKDLGEIVDVLWLSGTPSLQIPYLLNIALTVTSYIPAFPPAPMGTFKLLRKLDHAFSSLMKGEDSISGEMLPGFESGKRAIMTKTDMVRCKSLIESTRVLVVEHMSQEPEVEVEESGNDTEAISVDNHGGGQDEDDSHDMDVARVYEMTIVCLNEVLDSGMAFSVANQVSNIQLEDIHEDSPEEKFQIDELDDDDY